MGDNRTMGVNNGDFEINEFGEIVRIEKPTEAQRDSEIPQFTPPNPSQMVDINEFGEIIRPENSMAQSNTEVPTFSPPTPMLEKVSIEEVKHLQEEMFPEIYKDKQIEIRKEHDNVHQQWLGQDKEL